MIMLMEILRYIFGSRARIKFSIASHKIHFSSQLSRRLAVRPHPPTPKKGAVAM